MELCNAREMKGLLEANGFHFSKAKGQNFLTAAWVPQRIAEEAGVDRQTGVLEVGPGIGPLTEQLCLRAGKVLAVELDRRLKPILAQTVGHFENLELRFADVMDLDLRRLVEESFPGLRPIACANLPYYITSPILTKLLESRAFDSVTVMIQKEVAQRICAAPGTGEGSAFSVFCHWYAAPQSLTDVPPACFLPQPQVTSTVISLKIRQAPPCSVADERLFFRVVRAAFAQRRKTLSNALSAGFSELDKAAISAILTLMKIPFLFRFVVGNFSPVSPSDAVSPPSVKTSSPSGTSPLSPSFASDEESAEDAVTSFSANSSKRVALSAFMLKFAEPTRFPLNR